IEDGYGAVVGSAIEVSVLCLDRRSLRIGSVGCVGEVIKFRESSTGRDLKDDSEALAALIGGAVKVAVQAHANAALRISAMGQVKVVDVGEGARGRDLENVPIEVDAAAGGSSVDVTVSSLGHQTGSPGAASVGFFEVVHVGVGLSA